MSYYNHIAPQWEKATGARGGAFKSEVLNTRLLDLIGDISGRDVLELGAGNGYFARMLWRRHCGREPARMVVTDASDRLLELARVRHRTPGAEYSVLDVRKTFPFPSQSFDLVVAVMLFNELGGRAVANALAEAARVLRIGGWMVGATLHPDFVESLRRRGEIRRGRITTMPGPGRIRLPVVARSKQALRRLFVAAGLSVELEDLFPTPRVMRAKRGLRHAGARTPLALAFSACKTVEAEERKYPCHCE